MPRPPATFNAYETLNLAPTASAEQIRLAYKQLALRHHPDRNPGSADDERRMREVNAAYTILRDPLRRRLHDAMLQGAAVRTGGAKAGETTAGGLRLHPWELRLLAAALRLSLGLVALVRRPARSPLAWAAVGLALAGLGYATFPASAVLLVLLLLLGFGAQCLLLIYLLLRFGRQGWRR